MLKGLQEKDFEAVVKNSEKKVILKFTADWWPACVQLAPVVNEVSETLTEVEFYSVDVDESPGLAKQFGVMSIPTMILFNSGEEIDRKNGFAPEDVVKEFANQ